jgi:hypothetical protein
MRGQLDSLTALKCASLKRGDILLRATNVGMAKFPSFAIMSLVFQKKSVLSVLGSIQYHDVFSSYLGSSKFMTNRRDLMLVSPVPDFALLPAQSKLGPSLAYTQGNFWAELLQQQLEQLFQLSHFRSSFP